MSADPTTQAITIHLDRDQGTALDAIAAATSRDRAAIVAEAIDSYLQLEIWRQEHIAEGLRQAEAGEFAGDDEITEVYDRRR